MGKSWGVILLALFLLIWGLTALTNFRVVYTDVIQGLLAIGSGICLLLGK